VLTSSLIPHLQAAYPEARLDVLASPSNRAVFEANPWIDRVIVAERNWFERRPGGWALWTAVWSLGRSLRAQGYHLGIDVRGDVLSVLVLALAGIPRRVGWAMGGGGFLLTDVAGWVPGRHEVRSRLALLECLGLRAEGPVRVDVHPTDQDRARINVLLRDRWPHRTLGSKREPSRILVGGRSRSAPGLPPIANGMDVPCEADQLHAGRFGADPPLLAAHLGAGTPAKRWPVAHWKVLIPLFLSDGWRVVIVGGPEDLPASAGLREHPRLLDLTARLSIAETTALLERADLFIGADSGPAHLAACARVPSIILFSGTNRHRQWRPWSRRALVLRARVPCRPCHQKSCPLADHPCMSGLRPERVHAAARRWWKWLSAA
jgi:ADP-heptose:LPS heptosyltransferase